MNLFSFVNATLPVYRDVYRLILLIYRYTRDFPREYKYTLGQDMKRDAIMLVRSIYRANRSENKRHWLEEFLDNFEILKLEIRLSTDTAPRLSAAYPDNGGVKLLQPINAENLFLVNVMGKFRND